MKARCIQINAKANRFNKRFDCFNIRFKPFVNKSSLKPNAYTKDSAFVKNYADACTSKNDLIVQNHADACTTTDVPIVKNRADACTNTADLIVKNHADPCTNTDGLIVVFSNSYALKVINQYDKQALM